MPEIFSQCYFVNGKDDEFKGFSITERSLLKTKCGLGEDDGGSTPRLCKVVLYPQIRSEFSDRGIDAISITDGCPETDPQHLHYCRAHYYRST
jgi:hypothetical protein